MAYLWQGQAFLLAGVLGMGDVFTPGAELHGSEFSLQKGKQELRSERGAGGCFCHFGLVAERNTGVGEPGRALGRGLHCPPSCRWGGEAGWELGMAGPSE